MLVNPCKGKTIIGYSCFNIWSKVGRVPKVGGLRQLPRSRVGRGGWGGVEGGENYDASLDAQSTTQIFPPEIYNVNIQEHILPFFEDIL